MPTKFKPLPTALLAAALLTACGDGTPAPGINTDEDGETGAARDTTPRNIDNVTVRDSDGNTVRSLSVLDPVTLSFTAENAQGDPVGGASGRYSIQVPAGGRQLFAGDFTADAEGAVSIPLSLDDPTVGGTGQLQVRFTIEGSASRAAPPQPFTVAQQSGIPVSFDLDLLRDAFRSDSDITSISTDNPGFVVARMRDYQNVPVNDQIVTMETDTGTVQGNGRALSDADGRATARLEVGMDTPGSAGTVTVTVQGRSSGEGEEPDWRLDPQQLNFAIVERGAVSTSGYQIAVALHSSSTILDDSTKVAAVDLLRPTFAVVTVTSSSDDPLADLVIEVETPEDIVTVTPASGRALTNADGIAFVELRAEAADAREVGTLSATVAGTEVQAELNFTVGSLDLKLGRDNNGFANAGDIDFAEGEIDTGLATGAELAAAGTTLLRVVAVAADAETQGADTPLTINFESDCTRAGTATIDSPVTAVRGIATATYNAAGGCTGTDTVRASIDRVSGAEATATIAIQAATANSIRFVSATPETIVLRGTGDQENAELTFQVVDENGNPVPNQPVTARLSTRFGGLSLAGESENDDGEFTTTVTSNAMGEVAFTVNAGAVPTPVRVIATITVAGKEISTVSSDLALSTGLPDNNSFSLAVETLNPGGWQEDGVTTEVTLRAADAFNNPVPDGTGIAFTTEYGDIEPECQTENGTCTVTWESQRPRRPDDETVTGPVLQIGGRSAEGEGGHHGCDINGDGALNLLNVPVIGLRDLPLQLDLRGILPSRLRNIWPRPTPPATPPAPTDPPMLSPDEWADLNNNVWQPLQALQDATPTEPFLWTRTDHADLPDDPAFDEAFLRERGAPPRIMRVVRAVDGVRAFLQVQEAAGIDPRNSVRDARDISNAPCPQSDTEAGVPRPRLPGPLTDANDPDFPGQVYGGRSSLLAYADGVESFVDANADGLYSWIDTDKDGCYEDGEVEYGLNAEGGIDDTTCDKNVGTENLEQWTDLPEAFLDQNEDGVFGNRSTIDACQTAADATAKPDQCAGWQKGGEEEEHIDFNANETYNGDEDGDTNNGRQGNGIYNGTACHPLVAAAGDCTTDLVHVRARQVILMSALNPRLAVYDRNAILVARNGVDSVNVSDGPVVRHYHISDLNNGYLGNGSTVEIDGGGSNCRVAGVRTIDIGQRNSTGHTVLSIAYSIGPDVDEENPVDELTMTIQSRAGSQTENIELEFTCTAPTP